MQSSCAKRHLFICTLLLIEHCDTSLVRFICLVPLWLLNKCLRCLRGPHQTQKVLEKMKSLSRKTPDMIHRIIILRTKRALTTYNTRRHGSSNSTKLRPSLRAKGNSRNVAAEGGIVSVYHGGTLIGALIAGSLADRCGRIKAVVFGSLWVLLGAVLQASAYNIAWMCCARVISGVGVGAIDCVFSGWSAEF